MKRQDYIIHNIAVKKLYHNLDSIIKKYNMKEKRLIMFGSSIICGMIIDYLERNHISVFAIIDNDEARNGKTVYGKRIYKPEDYFQQYGADTAVILIASSFYRSMIEQLQGLGCLKENIHMAIDLVKEMEDYSHVNRKNMQKLTDADIKKCMIHNLKKLKELCELHHLRYYLQSGTLLGAIRHKGFIPWDDDVDVFMPVDDLIQLAKILKKDERYRIISQFDNEIYLGMGLAYLVDLNIISDINKFPVQLTTGFSIDVFPLYGMPEKDAELQQYIETVKKMECDCVNSFDREAEYKKTILAFNKYLLSFSYEKASTVGNILLPGFLRCVLSKEMLGTGCEAEFEGENFSVPVQWDVYLRQLYGDYMALPPEKERITRKHYAHSYWKDNVDGLVME